MQGKNEYILIDGERRFKAIESLARLDGRYTLVDCTLFNPKDSLLIQLSTDLHKQKLNPLEEGEAFKILINKNYDTQDIASVLGKNKSYVFQRLKLTGFSDKTKELIKQKVIPSSLLYSLDLDEVKKAESRIIERIIAEKPDEGEVRKIIKEEVIESRLFIEHFMDNIKKFNEDLNRFIIKIKNHKIENIEDWQEKTITDLIFKLDHFIKQKDVLLTAFDETNNLRSKLYELKTKYGKGTVIDGNIINQI